MSATQPLNRQDGFAAVDAMVALAILATTVVLSLAAVQLAVRLSAAAAETHRADGELRYLLGAAPRAVGEVSGEGGGFRWRVRMAPEPGSRRGAVQMCARTATARSTASGRTYALGACLQGHARLSCGKSSMSLPAPTATSPA